MVPAREHLERRARRLEWATVGWNSSEAVVAISTGIVAHSLALTAFGLDSAVEVFASLVVLWHLRSRPADEIAGEERRSLRIIAGAFFVLALYLAVETARHVAGAAHEGGTSLAGAVFMGATVVAMVVLGTAKRRTGGALGDHPLCANAAMTLLDAGLAAGTLAALALSRWFGWTGTQAIVAGAVALVAVREGRDNWRGVPD